MLKSDNYTIRTMVRSEVDFAINLARREGWNPGLNDAECFYQADPKGFFIGILGSQPIGCISAVSYQPGFGFIGLYIVVPEFRRQGYGIRLCQVATKHLVGHNIGLDSVPGQETNYMKSGYRRAYRNIRFEAYSRRVPAPGGPEIKPLQQVPFQKVTEYDRQCFPADRIHFLRHWLKMPSSNAIGYIDGNQLRGYGVMRRCYHGYKIGPLFADDMDIAERLYIQLVSGANKEEPVYLDIPEVNAAALSLVQKYGMQEVFTTIRMYTKEQPDIALDKIFGVTSFELG